jgi:hypothetical protein
VQAVLDKDVTCEPWYGCSDGLTTSYLKLSTSAVVQEFLNYTGPCAADYRGVKIMGLYQNRIVVKVGTSTLTNELGQSDLRAFDRLACGPWLTFRTRATR